MEKPLLYMVSTSLIRDHGEGKRTPFHFLFICGKVALHGIPVGMPQHFRNDRKGSSRIKEP
jgi:hypothetical protein